MIQYVASIWLPYLHLTNTHFCKIKLVTSFLPMSYYFFKNFIYLFIYCLFSIVILQLKVTFFFHYSENKAKKVMFPFNIFETILNYMCSFYQNLQIAIFQIYQESFFEMLLIKLMSIKD